MSKLIPSTTRCVAPINVPPAWRKGQKGIEMKANPAVPNSGCAVPMRNQRTGAAWLVSFNYIEGTYWHEPQGNLRHIRRPYASRSLEPHLVPAGTGMH
ncbi:TPA: hypothetical protein JLN09_001807 [Escherichia coli]|nr:hypothetical protein [Escherichia coli]